MKMTGLDGDVVDVDLHALNALSATFPRRVLEPGDARFSAAVRRWTAASSATPAERKSVV
jgi:hypothetical protein